MKLASCTIMYSGPAPSKRGKPARSPGSGTTTYQRICSRAKWRRRRRGQLRSARNPMHFNPASYRQTASRAGPVNPLVVGATRAGIKDPPTAWVAAAMKYGCFSARFSNDRDPAPIASAPWALPIAMSARRSGVPSSAANTLSTPRASNMTTVIGARDLARAYAGRHSRRSVL
jgi:hypothetical protein